MTKLEIINQAYGMVGEDPLTSLTENTRQASTANLYFDRVMDSVLRHRDWNCARRRRTLSRAAEDLGNPASNEFTFVYAVPADCLAIRRMTGSIKFPRYSIETIFFNNQTYRVLYTDHSTCTIVYTAKVEAPYLDPMALDCIVTRLAAEFAPASRQRDFKLGEYYMKLYQVKLTEAAGVDEAESDIDTGSDRTLTEVR